MSTFGLIAFIVCDVYVMQKLANDYVYGDRGNGHLLRLVLGIIFIALSAFYIAYYAKGKL